MTQRTIPLFPLHTVLFPRTPLTLRVFEERYRIMVQRCMEDARPFGVVLIREGEEVGDPAVPHETGTLAQIRNVSTVGNQLVLEVEGTDRFSLADFDTEVEPYLIGSAKTLRDEPYDPAIVLPLAAEVRGLFHAYFERLVRLASQAAPHYQLPNDAEDLSYVIAAVMQQTPLLTRQSMLEMTDTRLRLETERDLLKQELERIGQAAEDMIGDAIPLMPGSADEFNRN
jgi:Lon protease-like protein